MQGSGTGHSLRSNAHHLDAYSESLQQLSYQSPTWLAEANELSIGGDGGVISEGDVGAAGHDSETIMSQRKLRQRQQQQQRRQGQGQVDSEEEAVQWGLWHDGDGVDALANSEEAKGPEVQADTRCVTTTPNKLRTESENGLSHRGMSIRGIAQIAEVIPSARGFNQSIFMRVLLRMKATLIFSSFFHTCLVGTTLYFVYNCT